MNKLIIAALSIFVSFQAAAVNLYTAGTEAHKMSAYIADIIPAQMSVYFVQEANPEFFGNQVDIGKVKQAGISSSSLKKADAKRFTGLSVARGAAATVVDRTMPENAVEPTLCIIYWREDRKVKSYVGLVHEAFHCKLRTMLRNPKYVQAVMPALQTKSTLEVGFKYSYFEEMLVGAMLISVENKPEIAKAYRRNVVASISKGKNYDGSIGFNMQKRLLEVCPNENSCVDEPISAANKITSDPVMLKAINADLLEFEKKNFTKIKAS